MKQDVSVIGLDLAKNVFQVHCIDLNGKVVLRKQVKRNQLRHFFTTQIPPCLVGIEACGGAHYWARELEALGHTVKLMAPQFVKPYLKGNKNDSNDAEAICEAVQRPSMRFVAAKNSDQQALFSLHSGRELLKTQRKSIGNHLFSQLMEYGIADSTQRGGLKRIALYLEDAENGLPMWVRELLAEMKHQYDNLLEGEQKLTASIEAWHRESEHSQQLATIAGVGTLTATALSVHIGDGKQYKQGRQAAAHIGLVPKQASSGGKECLLSISKRGDKHLRQLLANGARSVVGHEKRRMDKGQPAKHPWIRNLLMRKHFNVVVIAFANKIVRTAWAMTVNKTSYQAPTAA